MYPMILQDTKIRKPGKNKCPPTTLDITHIRIQSKFHKSAESLETKRWPGPLRRALFCPVPQASVPAAQATDETLEPLRRENKETYDELILITCLRIHQGPFS
ncbi:Cilia- And Flagella-Associated Protein 44 [Manis pentadactyla]|nr:Cilia- And Flagella-Associated Protein 44 [Manis pentadactyla]